MVFQTQIYYIPFDQLSLHQGNLHETYLSHFVPLLQKRICTFNVFYVQQKEYCKVKNTAKYTQQGKKSYFS